MSKLNSIVQIVSLDETGDSAYRMEWPARALASQNSTWSVCNVDCNHPDRFNLASCADLLVLFNCSDIDFLTIIEKRRKKGLKTLVEYNDNFYEPQPWSPVGKEWSSWQIQQVYELFMKQADGVIVTGDGLYKLFSTITNKPIYIIHNLLAEISHTFDQISSHKIKSSIGWAGSLGHIADILSVAPLISSIIRESDEYSFHVMGNESLESNLNIPQNQFKYTPWGTIQNYYDFWGPISVGLIPMLDTAYNQCRSDIKVIEMISCGVLPVVPDLLPYKDLISKFRLPCYSDHTSLQKVLHQSIHFSDIERNNILRPAFEWIVVNRTNATCFVRKDIYQKHLSESSQNQNWGYPVGYHLVKNGQNAAQIEPLYITELKKIQAIQKSGNDQLAIEQLTRLHVESPNHPEITLSYLNYLIKSDYIVGYTSLKEYSSIFNKDIRYQAMLISYAQTIDDKIRLIRNLLSIVRNQTSNYINAVRPNIARLILAFIKQLSDNFNEASFDVCEEFLLLYPYSYSVRFALAECYQKCGYHKEARGHFAALVQAKKQFDQGFAEIADLDYGYLAAWSEACDKRVKGKLR